MDAITYTGVRANLAAAMDRVCNDHEPLIINITQAETIGGYRIRLRFDDGSVQVVDFEPFLRRARHPDVQAFLETKRFAAFRIEFGNLVWGDFEMCFPIIDLHANSIDKQIALEGQM